MRQWPLDRCSTAFVRCFWPSGCVADRRARKDFPPKTPLPPSNMRLPTAAMDSSSTCASPATGARSCVTIRSLMARKSLPRITPIWSALATSLACLEDVLARFGDRAYLDIELKVGGNEEAVVAALHASPPQRGYVVSSFFPDVLLRLHRDRSVAAVGLYLRPIAKTSSAGRSCQSRSSFRSTSWSRKQLIDEVHRRGLKLLDLDGESASATCLRLAAWGVDGLISRRSRIC